VFPVLRLPAVLCPALRPPASHNMRSHCVTQCFLCCVSLPCAALPYVRLRLNVRPALLSKHRTVTRYARGCNLIHGLRWADIHKTKKSAAGLCADPIY